MINVATIGSGFGVYGLLPAFSAVEKCRVVSVCGEKNERVTEACKKYGIENIYSDWREMLEKEDLEAIAVAVTPDAQYEILKTAIPKGINVFAEKPLAANFQQAKEIYNLSREYNITSAIDFIFPQIEEWCVAKKILCERVYGELKHVSVNWNFCSYDIKNAISSWKTEVERGGGALSFYFSHTLHYLEDFVGDILEVSSILSSSEEAKNGGDVGVDIILKFKNGVVGNAAIYTNDKGVKTHKLVFVCEKATIILENTEDIVKSFNLIVNDSATVFNPVQGKEIISNDEDERVSVVKNLAEKFIDACISKQKFYPSFDQGLRVQGLIEKIRINQI